MKYDDIKIPELTGYFSIYEVSISFKLKYPRGRRDQGRMENEGLLHILSSGVAVDLSGGYLVGAYSPTSFSRE